MSCPMGKPTMCIRENKDADQLCGTFVFATRRVQSFYFLNAKFHASSCLLCLYSSVCVGLFGNHIVGFPTRWLIFFFSENLLGSVEGNLKQQLNHATKIIADKLPFIDTSEFHLQFKYQCRSFINSSN